MATLITDPYIEHRIRSERAALGHNWRDEVWEGVYMMTPFPDLEHQDLAFILGGVIQASLRSPGLDKVYMSINVSDREQDWMQNFRGPDVAVILADGKARKFDACVCGGPDFIIEIISPDDHSREKLQFYGQIGVRELLLVDRDPWGLELYRLGGGQLQLVGKSSLVESAILASTVLPLSFRLLPGNPRPQIEATGHDGVHKWEI